VLSVSSRPAAASPDDALDYVKDAIIAADERGGKCKRDVFEGLLEIRDLLQDGSNGRAAVKIQRLRRDADRCPPSVDRALKRASDALGEDRRRVRERNDDRRDDRRWDRRSEPPRRAADIPWADFAPACLDHWLVVEISRGRIDDAKHHDLANATSAACTNPGALANTSYYANGQTAVASSGTWYYPNGQTARTANGTFYYPNGQTARTANGTWYYPNGQTAWTPSSGWYYPNGSLAGAYETVMGWGRQRVSQQQDAVYAYAMQSDAEPYRMYVSVRLLSQAK
jgi:hypothetical protein